METCEQKTTITEADVKELGERNELLLREMERFDRMTKSIQRLVGGEVTARRPRDYMPASTYGNTAFRGTSDWKL